MPCREAGMSTTLLAIGAGRCRVESVNVPR